MALSFPNSPSLNDVYTYGGKSWQWNGNYWISINYGQQGVSGAQGAQGLQGTQGLQGATGLAFTIAKTYASVAALTADTSPASIIPGQFALINTANVEDAENSKLYIWDGSSYIFVDDLSGAAGIQGVTGSQGVTGIQGALGTQGAQGTQGLQGIQGIQGATGSQGTLGAQGSQGLQGIQGTEGSQGIQGVQGLHGTSGTQGTQGAQGLQGIIGSQGAQGTAGFVGSNGAQGSQGVQGAQGGQGVQGTQGIQGLQGTEGSQGVQGLQGLQGTAGFVGSNGAQGIQGIQGVTGSQGSNGSTGNTGSTGAQGIQGLQGIQGTQGIQGLKGTKISHSENPPSSPNVNDLWWNSSDAVLMIYYDDGDSTQWVSANSGMVGPQGTNGSQGTTGLGVATTGPLYGRLRKAISGTITSSSDVNWTSPDEFNVKDYGAVGDDSTDDSSAFAAALAAACAAGRGVTLKIPHGSYKILDTLTGTFGVNNQMYGLTIAGDGIGTSIIKQYGTNKGVFNITNSAVAGCLTVRNLSCWNQPGVMSTQACIKYEVTQIANDDAHANLRVDNLQIASPFGAGTWAIGLDLYRVHCGNISNYQYCGDNAGGGTGIVFQKSGVAATAGSNKSMACVIQASQMNLCGTGVMIKDSMETCLIDKCLMVGVVYGVQADYCIHLGVSNSHINASTNAILSTGVGAGGAVDQGLITNNSLYADSANVESVKGPFVRSVISGNQFLSTAQSSGTVGVRLTTGSTGNNISGNTFAWHVLSYVIADSGSTYNMVTGNMASRNNAAATTPFNNQGGGTNSFTNNIYQP
jgi:hypothetical protein